MLFRHRFFQKMQQKKTGAKWIMNEGKSGIKH